VKLRSGSAANKGTVGTAAVKNLAPRTPLRTPLAKPGDAVEIAAFRNAQREGQNKVDDFIAAIKSKDPEPINEAAMRIQGDNRAIANLNGRNNFIKRQFNATMQNSYDKVDKRVMERLAQQYNLRPDQIRVVSAANVNADRALTNVRVGYDRDITFRINNF
jgi:hypothetical protein